MSTLLVLHRYLAPAMRPLTEAATPSGLIRNEQTPSRLSGMPDDLRSQITAEIKRVNAEIEQQKTLIKNNIGRKLVIETAEQEMKALHTRLSVLEANLAKETAKSQTA